MKKNFVLAVLFLLPISAYLFFSSGVNNFARLPVLTSGVADITHLRTKGDSIIHFQDRINVVAFFGNQPDDLVGNTFNLDQKILGHFYEFKDFQFVIILPEESREAATRFVNDFKGVTEPEYWKFAFGNEEEIKAVFDSFNSNFELDENLQTPYVFLVDKELNLRGRPDDEDKGLLYGYDSRSVYELSSKMKDDVKILLAEYRLALKKNNTAPVD